MGVIQYCLVFFFFFLLIGCNKQEVNVLKENSLENERSMVKAKSLVIIVPGYELVQSRYPTFFVDFTSQFLGVDKNDNWPTDLAKYVKSHSNYDVEVFNWKPGLTKRFSFRPAAEDLAELLKKKKDYRDVTIFSKSVGGIVSQLALEELDGQKNIKRLIYVATPQGSTNPKLPENIEVINVFSRDDTMARRANFLLHLSRVYELEERVNLELPGLTHSEFNYNLEVTYEGKKVKLYDLYVQLMTMSLH